MNLKNQNGFTLVEILVAIGLLALILGVSMQIFTSSSKSLSHLEKQLFSQFVAENIMVSSFLFEDELFNSSGISKQANKEFLWKREIISQDSKSIQIKIIVSDPENQQKIYELSSFKVVN
tara:strand:+ start:1652 stop:2011 length:360 start_codon:yes stop_codon:yes gene_type:complete